MEVSGDWPGSHHALQLHAPSDLGTSYVACSLRSSAFHTRATFLSNPFTYGSSEKGLFILKIQHIVSYLSNCSLESILLLIVKGSTCFVSVCFEYYLAASINRLHLYYSSPAPPSWSHFIIIQV